jgi:hypothetical protein
MASDSSFTGLAPRKYFSSYGNGGINFGQVWDAREVVYDINNGRVLGTGAWRAIDANDFQPASTTAPNSLPGTGAIATGLAINSNFDRKSWYIQNNAINPLYVRFGDIASAQNFNMILSSASATRSGDGGVFYDDGPRWLGAVYVSGQGNLDYVAWELT